MRLLVFLFTLGICCSSCGEVKEGELIVIDSFFDTEGKTHIGQGFYLKLPSGFYLGRSYEGAQNNKRTAAVSLKVKYKTISELKAQLNKNRLDYLNEKLISLNPVKIGDIDSALYIVLENIPKRRMKHQLLLNDGGNETYALSGYTIIDDVSLPKDVMKDIVFSVSKGEEVEKEASFKMAILKDGGKLVYTKDGKYPTEDNTAAEISISVKEPFRGDPWDYMKRITNTYVSTMKIGNGKMYSARINSEDGSKKLIRMIVPDSGTIRFIECKGNDKVEFKDFIDFLNNEFIQTVVD